ncbi:DUF1206 domain-containing protein [Mycobacterium nebraskense]|nr:DUF1206 domain-containing protein [Mycobacterium nebraskense]MBI2696734.1 DUF1206 domain-containing protein [Mycobacterium nebraskense]MCV7115970.1 DUF1206 domain-containing protein [Mycobacterium nebraskense]
MSDIASPVTAARLAQNSVFERLARVGFVVSGVVHLIVGYLAIRVACGDRGTADQTGALATLAAKPGGPLALWIATAGLLAMGIWRLVETALGRSSDRESNGSSSDASSRVKALGLAAVYLAFAYSAFGFARGAGRPADQQNSGISARLMETTGGTIALICCGVVVVAVGGYHIYKGASRNFVNDLQGRSGDLVRRLGVAGYVGKGVVIMLTGALVIVAACRSEPKKATGLDGALKTLGAQHYGAALLIAAGVGIITYGLYSFVMARSTKM